eukprot:4567733-Karenia_brevis.AAC.1
MEDAYKKDDPMWMAYLATWLQTFACICLAHVRRSFPARVYEGRVECFCVHGRKNHDGSGYDWGAPSETIN